MFSTKKPYDGLRLIAKVPEGSGDIIDVCIFQGRYIVACKDGLYELKKGALEKIEFKEPA